MHSVVGCLASGARSGDHGEVMPANPSSSLPAASPAASAPAGTPPAPSSPGLSTPGPSTPAPSSGSVRRRGRGGAQPWDSWSDRKKTTVVAVVFFGVLAVLLGAVLISAYVGYHPSAEQRAAARNEAIAEPQSISGPDYGRQPSNPGDPGGWEQLAIGGLIAVAIAGGAAYVIRSSRRTRLARSRTPGDGELPAPG